MNPVAINCVSVCSLSGSARNTSRGETNARTRSDIFFATPFGVWATALCIASTCTMRARSSTLALRGVGHPFAEHMRYRAFFVFLAMRDIRLRYTRTWRGVLWALIQPLLPMLIFAGIFARVIRPQLYQVPYWLFVLTGIAVWSFFANAVNYASTTFVANLNLVNKVYFPRAILPLAAVAACVVDLLIAVGVLLPVCYFMGFHPGLRLLALPIVLFAATVLGAITGTAAASLNALHRDFSRWFPSLFKSACMLRRCSIQS